VETTDYADSTDEKSGEISHGGHRNTGKTLKGMFLDLMLRNFNVS